MSITVKFDTEKILKEVTAAAAEGLKAVAKELAQDSQKLCPKDRGYNGGLVSTYYDEVDPESLRLKAGYSADHAKIQHWKREFKHKQGEQTLYLSQPLTQNGPRYLGIIAEHIRRELK